MRADRRAHALPEGHARPILRGRLTRFALGLEVEPKAPPIRQIVRKKCGTPKRYSIVNYRLWYHALDWRKRRVGKCKADEAPPPALLPGPERWCLQP